MMTDLTWMAYAALDAIRREMEGNNAETDPHVNDADPVVVDPAAHT